MSVGGNVWDVCACLNANDRMCKLLQERIGKKIPF